MRAMNHPIIDFAMHLLSMIFLIGMAGSAIVVAISFVEDLYELFRRVKPQGITANVTSSN